MPRMHFLRSLTLIEGKYFENWVSTNNLKLSVKKTKCLSFNTKTVKIVLDL